jgi:hypothetical protein
MKSFLKQVFLVLSLCGVALAGDFTRDRFTHIDAIRITEMTYKAHSLDSILIALIGKIESLDTSPGGPHRMSIIEGQIEREHKLPLADFSVRKATVKEALGDLSRIFGVTFHATSIGIVVTPDGTRPFPNYKAKEGVVFHTYRKSQSESGNGQPATHPELKSEGNEKPKPEAEGHPR